MVSKARHVVAVLGVPDAAKEPEALARRRELAGGKDAYAARYRGLDHLYYDRDWFVMTLKNHGLVDVHVEDQEIEVTTMPRFGSIVGASSPGTTVRGPPAGADSASAKCQ
jgi:hypothetical protein